MKHDRGGLLVHHTSEARRFQGSMAFLICPSRVGAQNTAGPRGSPGRVQARALEIRAPPQSERRGAMIMIMAVLAIGATEHTPATLNARHSRCVCDRDENRACVLVCFVLCSVVRAL